jgi:hypothetical protein
MRLVDSIEGSTFPSFFSFFFAECAQNQVKQPATEARVAGNSGQRPQSIGEGGKAYDQASSIPILLYYPNGIARASGFPFWNSLLIFPNFFGISFPGFLPRCHQSPKTAKA